MPIVDPITEQELRRQLKDWLAPRITRPGARLVEEFGIERGAARIDLAVITDDFEAFEIKSDLDSFMRMRNQIHAYNRVFGRLWIVTGPLNAEPAARIVPRWWGILTATRALDRTLEFVEVRPAIVNPIQEAMSIAMLLWREEALSLLEAAGLGPVSTRATRAQLSERLATALELDSLRSLVARVIAGRDAATAGLQ